MRPAAEGQVPPLTAEVDHIRVRVLGRVPVRDRHHDLHQRAGRDELAGHRNVLGGHPRHEEQRAVHPEQFLHRGRDDRRFVGDPAAQCGLAGQHGERGAQRRGDRLQPGQHEQERQPVDLLVGQPVVAGLRGQQLAEQAGSGAVPAPLGDVLDQVLEEFRTQPDRALAQGLPGLGGPGPQQALFPGVQPVPVGRGQAEQGQEHLGWQRHGQVFDQVAVVPAGQAIDQLSGQRAHLRKPGRHPARAEEWLQDAPVPGVLRRVEGDRDQRQRAADQVERALGGEQPRVLEGELSRLAGGDQVGPERGAEHRAGLAEEAVGGRPVLSHRQPVQPDRRGFGFCGHSPVILRSSRIPVLPNLGLARPGTGQTRRYRAA